MYKFIAQYGIDCDGYIIANFEEDILAELISHGIVRQMPFSDKLIWGKGYLEKYGINAWRRYQIT